MENKKKSKYELSSDKEHHNTNKVSILKIFKGILKIRYY
jgi:hypothetical protein